MADQLEQQAADNPEVVVDWRARALRAEAEAQVLRQQLDVIRVVVDSTTQ